MSTLTITEFLEARIAEDEAVARAATDGPWRLDPGTGGVYCIAVSRREFTSDPEGLTFYAERDWVEDATHIARHDPARALAECAAKRAIIAEHQQDHLGAVCTRCRFIGGYMEYPCPTLEALAAVYADHEDYDPGWAL